MKVIKKANHGIFGNLGSCINLLERKLTANIRASYPGKWESSALNLKLLKIFAELLPAIKLKLAGSSVRFSIEVLKQRKADDSFADIGFSVDSAYHDGHRVNGVFCLSTHIKDPDKNTFSAIKIPHLKKIAVNSPHSQLLLYDYDKICDMALPSEPEWVSSDPGTSWNSWSPFTHAALVPANIAVEISQKTTGLYKISLPLSYQFFYRYIYGLDLDFQKAALDIVKGHRTDKGNPSYLVLLSIAHGGAPLNADHEYNRDIYVSALNP